MQVTLVLVVLVFGINTFLHQISKSFIFSLAIAIGLTPELYPWYTP
jgi:Mg2+-importing ATPase